MGLTTLIVGLDDMEFCIYDRWGQIMYKTNDMFHSGWDGSRDNILQQPGVYYYYILGTNIRTGGQIIKRGDITLIR